MKKSLLIIALLALVFVTKAQEKNVSFSFGIGPVLSTLQRPAIVDPIDDYYPNGFNEDPNGVLTLQGEWLVTNHFSLFGEFSTNRFAGNGHGQVYGDYSSTRSQLNYQNITVNGRWNMTNSKFVPYIDAGIGVASGTHYWNTTHASSVFGATAQLGIGAKLYFGKFGIFAETKTSYILNFKEFNTGSDIVPASDANLALQVLHCGVCFGF